MEFAEAITNQPAPCGLFYDHTTMSKKKSAPALAQPVNPDKWVIARAKERITLADHKAVPHLNSTMGGPPYRCPELHYRGKQA